MRVDDGSQQMWSIEVSEDASDEEVTAALLEEIDFDYIRECHAKLTNLIEVYGPLTEVDEEEVASVDSSLVWTLKSDPVNGYSYLINGAHTEDGIVENKSWFLAEKPFEPADEKLFSINIEFIIWQETIDSDDDSDPYYVLDLWELMDSDDLSDEAITEVISDLYDY